MNTQITRPGSLPFLFALFGVLLAAAPASAQWSQVPAIPSKNVFSIFSNADTIVATVDTAAYVSTNAGANWQVSKRPAPGVQIVQAAWFRNGRLYVGTGAQGVFVSDNLGTTWTAFNQGLVGGILNTQLDVVDLQQRGDSLYAGTGGAGVYVRGFAPAETWSHFGNIFEPEQASNITDLALGGNRLIASAGANGMVFYRDPGDPEWTLSFLNNTGISAGRAAQRAVYTGTGWVVGTNVSLHLSPTGQNPWQGFSLGLGALGNTAFATLGHRIFAAFDTPNFVLTANSDDDGATWFQLDVLPDVFVFQMTVVGDELYAARDDGLWVRSVDTVSAPPVAIGAGLSFAIAGAQPVGDTARLSFELAEAGSASIDVYDVRGRRVGERIEQSFPAGPNEISWSARDLRPGVYAARLSAHGRHAVVKLVHVR